jgi:hypothetical protein
MFGVTIIIAKGAHRLHRRYHGARAARRPEVCADIAIQTAEVARNMGFEPRVAFLSFATFGNPPDQQGRPGAGRGPRSTSGRSTSNTTARCRPTSPSTPS